MAIWLKPDISILDLGKIPFLIDATEPDWEDRCVEAGELVEDMVKKILSRSDPTWKDVPNG